MDEFPRGTVTFLVTDIQGSTEMWERYPDAMPRALERHEHLLREAVETRGGRVFKNVGDGLFIAFSAARRPSMRPCPRSVRSWARSGRPPLPSVSGWPSTAATRRSGRGITSDPRSTGWPAS